jgi:AraC-like DNA-binding protein
MRAQFEQLRTKPDRAFNAFIIGKKEFDTAFHFHPEYELTFILSSSGTRYVGNHFEDFGKNDLVLLGPNLPHCWKNFPAQKKPANAVVIHWDKAFIDEKWLDREEFLSIKKLLQSSSNGIRFNSATAVTFRNKLKILTTLEPFARFHYFLKILHELSLSNDIVQLTTDHDTHLLNYFNNERISFTLDHIREHYSQKITLADIAQKNKMTEEVFSRFFSKIMRKTFFCYLNEYRINQACKLLIDTDKSISEICYASGYDTQPFFFRQFKKFKKCTPGSYRTKY